MTEFTTRIIKGGALLAETRRFLDNWADDRPPRWNLEQILDRNLLGLPSRKRTGDTLAVLRQRFVEPGPSVIPSLRIASIDPIAFREVCYFEASRNDALLAFAAENVLYQWWELGRSAVPIEQFEGSILQASPDPAIREWRPATTRRVTSGLLSALRDFGILEGKNNKSISPPRLSLPGFAYVTERLREMEVTDIVGSPVWHRWILDERQIRALFLEADRVDLIRFSEAGSAHRVDWLFEDLEEMMSAAV